MANQPDDFQIPVLFTVHTNLLCERRVEKKKKIAGNRVKETRESLLLMVLPTARQLREISGLKLQN